MSITALIVDENRSAAGRVAALCKRVLVDPVQCHDGATAIEHIESMPALDLVVTQLSLPKADGFEVLRRFRRRSPRGRAIAVSSFAELRRSAMNERDALGVDVVLGSDLPDQAVLRVLQTIVSGASAQVERLAALESRAEPEADHAEDARQRCVRTERLDRVPVAPPDPELQQFVRGVAERSGVPILVLTLAVGRELVFPARHGIDAVSADRYTSLCNLVLDAGDPLFIPDAQRNPVARANAAVASGLVRGYASIPVHVDDGPPIGTLAAIDSERPLLLGLDALRTLRQGAREASTLLRARARSY